MAQERPSTPEKELLKLIEKPGGKGALQAATIRYQGMSLLSFDALQSRIIFLGGNLRRIFGSAGMPLNLRSPNAVAGNTRRMGAMDNA